jgi:methionine-gamma-lyase
MKKALPKKSNHRTQAIHGKYTTSAWQFDKHLIPPITSSTTFRLESLERGAQGFIEFADGSISEKPILIYDRLDEPSTLMLEEQLAQMESAACAVSFGSGMGAISAALMATTKSGDEILAHRTLYGCTYSLLTNWMPRMGVTTHFLNLNDPEIKNLLRNKRVRVIYCESVSNPSLEIINLISLVKLVKEENKQRSKEEKINIIVDNTFATPWGMRPLELGVDFVVQSLTKNICGFGTEMGGAILAKTASYAHQLKMIRKDFGAIIHPWSAWHILVYGISTQALRFEQQQQNALTIARFLEGHPKVAQVVYPGLPSHPQYKLAKTLLKSPEGKFSPGFMISFRLKGDDKTCARFVDDIAKNSYSITLAVSLGLTKTLIEVPGFMTHSAIPSKKQKETNLDPRDIRLSVGLESIEDLLHDLKTSLNKLKVR